MAERRDRDEKQRDRDLDLLKHVSMLDLAALILFLALVEPFRDFILRGGPDATVPTLGALEALSLSLLVSVVGLILLPVVRQVLVIRVFVVVAYVLFGVGVALASWFAWIALY